MEPSFRPKTRIELDSQGMYYASVTSREHPATYSISVYLTEPVVPHVLQEAVNDLMRRLPFLNGRLGRDFFWHYHEILPEPPMIVPAPNGHTFSAYFASGAGHVVRILYGERHLTVEAMHSICDGRGLLKTVSALLERYFEILGVAPEKPGLIDWAAAPRPEEAEDAYARYADMKTTDSVTRKFSSSAEGTAYRFEGSKPVPAYFVTRKFDLTRVRSAAKVYDATITEYVLAHIFRAIAQDRAARGRKEPITASVPIDCRSFFPSETYRNFVAEETIVMPETEDFAEMVYEVSHRFKQIDADLVLSDINSYQGIRRTARFLPLVAKTLVLKMLQRSLAKGITTSFSNLGLVKLPKEIEERIEMLEFVVGNEPGPSYDFACIAVADSLTLTTTVSAEDGGMAEWAADGLEG